MSLTIDSSVYLSGFLQNDPFHKRTKRFFQTIQGLQTSVILPALIPLEVCNTLHRQGVAQEQVAGIFQSFYQTHQIVALDQSLASTLIDSITPFDLKTADWIITGTGYQFKTQLITWDRELLKKTKKLLESQTPTQWLKHRGD